MIEKVIQDYLNGVLPVSVFMEEEQGMPEEYVLIEKTGSGEENFCKKATLVIRSFSTYLYGAAVLNEEVKKAMGKAVELDDISRCSLNSDYNYTDTARKKHRYQAVFDIVHY